MSTAEAAATTTKPAKQGNESPLRSGIYALTKQLLGATLRVQRKASDVLQDHVAALLMHLVDASVDVMKWAKRDTLSARDVKAGIISVLATNAAQQELASLAITNATLAETKYTASRKAPSDKPPAAAAGKRKSTPPKAKPMRAESRAGLHVSVSAVRNWVKFLLPHLSVKRAASVMLAATAEFILSEILELVKALLEETPDVKTLTAKHIVVAVYSDEGLRSLFEPLAFSWNGSQRKRLKSMSNPYQPKVALVLLDHQKAMEAERAEHEHQKQLKEQQQQQTVA